MKRFRATFLMLAALLAVSSSAYSERLRFEATLSGAQEVTDPAGGVDTETTGKIRVDFDEALTHAEFDLRVFDGMGVRVAHFHCGRAGENGPVVVFLFGPVDEGVDVDGELAEGTVTNADFRVADCDAAIGRPVNNIASLAFAAQDGLIYANVHTLANTGGEIRGQLLEKK
jgi:CHRD domain-containing protein